MLSEGSGVRGREGLESNQLVPGRMRMKRSTHLVITNASGSGHEIVACLIRGGNK